MAFVYMIVIGFLIGLVARVIKPGNDRMGFIMTTIVGIVGALIGGYIGRAMGIYSIGEPAGFIGSVLGAIIILFILQATLRRRPI